MLSSVYVFRSAAAKVGVLVAYIAVVALFLGPLLWMLSVSFKAPDEVFGEPLDLIPNHFQFDNFINAWNKYDFVRYAFNSLFVSITVTVVHVILASFAGFGLAKYRFIAKKYLLIAILSTIMLPVEVIMVPMYLVVRDFGWINTFQGLIVPTIADGFGVFLMYQFMKNVPNSLIEAARVDGANDIKIFFRVVLPLCWPAVATLAIFMWRESWDDFVWPFVLISDEAYRTVPLGIALFQQNYVTDYGQLMAISVLATIPLALVFLCFQRAFIRGIALQGLKG